MAWVIHLYAANRAAGFIWFNIAVCFSWRRERKKCTPWRSCRMMKCRTWNQLLWKFTTTMSPVCIDLFILHCICGLFCVRIHELEYDFCFSSPSVGDMAVTEYPSPCPVQWDDLRKSFLPLASFLSVSHLSANFHKLK